MFVVYSSFVDFSLSYKYANRLRYAAVVVNTTINPNILGYPTGLAIRDDWEDFLTNQVNHTKINYLSSNPLTISTKTQMQFRNQYQPVI